MGFAFEFCLEEKKNRAVAAAAALTAIRHTVEKLDGRGARPHLLPLLLLLLLLPLSLSLSLRCDRFYPNRKRGTGND